MKLATGNPSNDNRHKSNIKVIMGGPLGILAWSASAGTMLIIFIWGLEKSALAVVVVKVVSWGMWGIGAIRQSSCFNSLKERLRSVKQARRVPFRLSWGFTFYLHSMGEWGQLRYGQFPVRLNLYDEYHVPSEDIPPLFSVVCIHLETKGASLDWSPSMEMVIAVADLSAAQSLRVSYLELEKVNASVEVLDFPETNPETIF